MQLARALKVAITLLGLSRHAAAVGDIYPGQVSIPLDGGASDFADVTAVAANITKKNAKESVEEITRTLGEIGENLKRITDGWAQELVDPVSTVKLRVHEYETTTTPPFSDWWQSELFPHRQKYVKSATIALAALEAQGIVIGSLEECPSTRRALAGIGSSETYLAYELQKLLPNFAREIDEDRRGVTWLVRGVLKSINCTYWDRSESAALKLELA